MAKWTLKDDANAVSRLLLFAVGLAGGLGLASGALIFVGECLYWLQDGTWPSWTLAKSLGYVPQTSMKGVNKLILSYFDMPLSGSVFFTSMAALTGAIYGVIALEKSDHG